jgi:hypothetical protein
MDTAMCGLMSSAYGEFTESLPPPIDFVDDPDELMRLAALAQRVRERVKPVHDEIVACDEEIRQENTKIERIREAFRCLERDAPLEDSHKESLAEIEKKSVEECDGNVEALEAIRKKALEEQSYLVKIVTSFSSGSKKPIECPVCYADSVSMVYVPCGHTICSTCALLSRAEHCHTCRAQVSQTLRIYFTGNSDL